MATKNLARTIIEGGRASYNKFERRQSHKEERVIARTFLSRAGQIDEGFDAISIGKRPSVYKGFRDKLGAPRRWLRSQVGRPWDKVRSEIFTRFNPRSLAGQHIIFDHLLEEVQVHEVAGWRHPRSDLYVDRHGVLRAPKPQKRQPRARCSQSATATEVSRWADGRLVAGTGDALYWLVLARTCDSCTRRSRGHCCCPAGADGVVHGSHRHYRQDRRLSRMDMAFWTGLAECTQARLADTIIAESFR